MTDSTERSKTRTRVGAVITGDHARRRSGARGKNGVAAEHRDTRAVLRTAEGYHVLANVAAHKIAEVRVAVGQDVLDQVVSKLITSNYIVVSMNCL